MQEVRQGKCISRCLNNPAEKLRLFDQNCQGWQWFHTEAMFCARTKLAFNAPKDGRGIGQKQVLGQNLSSTDVHGRTSVERYTDAQQLKMVQMVSQPHFFCDFLSSLPDAFALLSKKCAKIP